MLRSFTLLLLVCAASLGEMQPASCGALQTEQIVASAAATVALKLGSRGEQVTTLQSRLRQLGYYSGAIDGQYGRSTQIAVTTFQQAAGLTADGRVGPQTWRQLDIAALTPAPTVAIKPSAAPVPTAPPATAAPVAPVAIRLALLAAGVGIAGAIYRTARHRRSANPVVAAASSQTVTVQSEQLAIPREQDAVAAESLAHENGFASSDQASGSLDLEAATVQETTRLPKINIATELLKDLHSSDSLLRRKAIWELGQRGESQAIQPLVDLMIDSDSQQRSLILAAIAEIGSRTLKPMQRALLISLQDESADVRKNAIRDLTRIYEQMVQTSQLLGHAVNDSDAEVQETARWALNQLNRIRTATGSEDATVLLPQNSPEYFASDRSTSPQ